MTKDEETGSGTGATAAAARGGLLRRFWARSRLDTIGGRYLLSAFLFVLFLVGAAGYATYRVGESTEQVLADAGERHAVRALLDALLEDVWAAESSLQGFLLTPNETFRQNTHMHLSNARGRMLQLANNPLVGELPQVQEHSEHLLRHLSELDRHTQRLMRIRTDPRELFPAMPVMLERMLPAYLEFYSAATLAMDRAEAEPDDPVQRRLYKLFSEARHAFTLTIGDFRNYVANRFGVFGDPEKAMRAQRSNLLLHAERTRAALGEIEKYAKQGRLDLPQEDAYAKMRRDFDRWMNAYREVSAIYSSERWRADTPLLRDTIQPLFAHTWETVRLLYKEIDARLAQDVVVVSRTAETLSRTFWLLAALGVLATLAGYLWFERTVRRPIVTVARALRAEAEGRAEVSLPPVRTVELEDLTAAFDHMRREVRSRQQRLETILDNAAEGIITFDRDGVIEGFNHAAEKLFGWREEEVRGSDITRLIVPDTAERRQGYLQHFLRNELKQLIGH
jgi:PAS domain-containing protein